MLIPMRPTTHATTHAKAAAVHHDAVRQEQKKTKMVGRPS